MTVALAKIAKYRKYCLPPGACAFQLKKPPGVCAVRLRVSAKRKMRRIGMRLVQEGLISGILVGPGHGGS